MTTPSSPAPAGLLARSGGLPVTEAIATLDTAERTGAVFFDSTAIEEQERLVAALTAAQIGWADLAAMARVLRYAEVSGLLVSVSLAWLADVEAHYPAMPVRDAFAWVLKARAENTLRASAQDEWVPHVIGPWEQVDLAEVGWLYAAAGYSPAEARAGLDAGTLTEDAARALVGLRGVSLPA